MRVLLRLLFVVLFLQVCASVPRAAPSLKEEILKESVLPWIYKHNPQLRERLPLLTEEQIHKCAAHIALAISRSCVYAKDSAASQKKNLEAHTRSLEKLLKEDKELMLSSVAPTTDELLEEERQRLKEYVVASPEERILRKKKLEEKIKKASSLEERSAVQQEIHNALEVEIQHRLHIVKHCPSIMDFPDERFLYLWKAFKERPQITTQELHRFLTMLFVMETLNQRAERDPRYKKYIEQKQMTAALQKKVMQERMALTQLCQEHSKAGGPRLQDALCSLAALDLLKKPCSHIQSQEKKEMRKGYFSAIQDFCPWSPQLITAIFSPFHGCKEELENMESVMKRLNQDIRTSRDCPQKIVQQFIMVYPKKISDVKKELFEMQEEL
jgi:hypothetical protein